MVIGKISIGLTARTAKFTKGMSRARRSMRGFRRSAARTAAKLATFGGALTALAAGGGLALMTKRSFAAMDATAKLADRMGMATEALGGLRHAAEITGAGTAALDKGLGFMSKSLGEAKQGIGEGKQALEAMGLSVKTLLAQSPGQQFRTIADAMAGLGTQSEKAFVATKLFGRGGLALINTLALGTEGLNKMQKEAERLGIAFTRVDAAKIEAANDAITRMKAVSAGVFNTLAVQLAPFVETLANKFTETGLAGKGMAARIVDGFEGVLKVLAKVSDYTNLLKGVFYGVAAAIQKALSLIFKGFTSQLHGILVLLSKLPKIGKQFAAANQYLKGFGKGLDDQAADSWKKALDFTDAFNRGDASKKVAAFFKDVRSKAQAAAEDAAKAMKTMTPKIPTPAEDAAKAMKTGQFKTINLHRMAIDTIGAGSDIQKFESPQIDKTNAILTAMNKGICGYMETVVHTPETTVNRFAERPIIDSPVERVVNRFAERPLIDSPNAAVNKVAIEGTAGMNRPSKVQEVKSRQFETANELLRLIANQHGGPLIIT